VHERLRSALEDVTGMPVRFHERWGLPGFQITYSHAVFAQSVFQAHIDGSFSPIMEEFGSGHVPGPSGVGRRGGEGGCVPHHRLSVTLSLQSPSSGAGLDQYSFRTHNNSTGANTGSHSDDGSADDGSGGGGSGGGGGCSKSAVNIAHKAMRHHEDLLSQEENRQRQQRLQRKNGQQHDHPHRHIEIGGAQKGEVEKANDSMRTETVAAAAEASRAAAAVARCLEHDLLRYETGVAVVHAGSVIHGVAPWRYTDSSYGQARITIQGFAFLCGGKWWLHW